MGAFYCACSRIKLARVRFPLGVIAAGSLAGLLRGFGLRPQARPGFGHFVVASFKSLWRPLWSPRRLYHI
ncbi:MAG: hypothetical protein COA65_02265 [Rhodospirillaceae bacterium]|nr:MAG: hypothetical protein COA65_02265 [Rhodospirillaceae bacterium]